MNVKYGGKQRVLRDTKLTEGCVGAGEAMMHWNGREWSTVFAAGVTDTRDLKLRVGDIQRMAFDDGDPPPFYACGAPKSDIMGNVASKKRRSMRAQESTPATGENDETGVVTDGYVGKAKGMRQVLWERGLHVDGMSTGANAAPHMRLDTVLGNLPDFRDEKPALVHLVESRGHIVLLSPKCHPEVAGVGIEYSWGMSKMKFRREINDEVPKNLHDNIVKSICPRNILTTERVRRFARRAREYCRSYRVLDEMGNIDGKEIIEKMRKKQKAHRNIIDMEPGFLNTQ